MTAWRPVVGFEGLYEVSDGGDVRSLDRVILCRDGRTLRLKGQMLQPYVTPGDNGRSRYRMVGLSRNGRERGTYVYRIAAAAWLGPRPDGQVIRHGPGGSLDDSAANLSYGTLKDNARDRVRDGTETRGSQVHCARLTEAIVLYCREMHRAGQVTYSALAREFGVSPQALRNAVLGKTWAHLSAGAL